MTARRTIKVERERRKTCIRCGRLGHLAPGCRASEKRIDKIGIEVEGYWFDLPAAQRVAVDITGHRGESDGSLGGAVTVGASVTPDDTCDDEDCDDCSSHRASRTGDQSARGWEFQTRAGSLGEALRQLTTLYPDVTSERAGMHVHMSLLHWSDFTMLASQRFYDHFATHMRAWGTRLSLRGQFWDRLEGRNQYCRPNREAEDHAYPGIIGSSDSGMGGKYKAINFSGYDSSRKTVEFRLLPMFQKAAIGVSAVETLVECVETYLDRAWSSVPVSVAMPNALAPIARASTVEANARAVSYAPHAGDHVIADHVLTLASEIVIPGALVESRDSVIVETYALTDASPGSTVALRCDALRAIENQLRNPSG